MVEYIIFYYILKYFLIKYETSSSIDQSEHFKKVSYAPLKKDTVGLFADISFWLFVIFHGIF